MLIRILALPAAFILTLPLMAATVYTYTGNDFTTATGPQLTTSDSITGSFTMSTPLGDNLNGGNVAGTALAFSFSDGPDTITNTTPGVSTCACSPVIDIYTNGSGAIVNWDITLTVGNLGAENITTQDYDAGIVRGTVIEDSGNYDNTGSDTADNVSDQGTWNPSTVSPAPEPGSLMLLGAGLAGVAFASRRRFRQS